MNRRSLLTAIAACGTAVMHTFDRNFCTAARAAGIAPEVRIWEV